MQGSMEEPQRAAPAPEAAGSKPEPVDFSEALLSSEKLPLDLQDDAPAGSTQVLACQSVQSPMMAAPAPHAHAQQA